MKLIHRLFYPPAWSIAAKISAALVSAALIPMSFTAYYNLRQSLEIVEASEYRKLELIATSTASRLDQLIIDIQRVLVQVSSDRNVVDFLSSTMPTKQGASRHQLQQTLQNLERSHPGIDAVFVMDRDGKCLASTDPTFVGKNYAFREYFRKSIQGNSYISRILVGQTTKRPGLFLSNPVRSDSGEIVGVTVLKMKGEDIWAIVNALPLGSESYAFLVNEHGIIISHRDKSLLYHSLNPLPKETRKQMLTDRRYGVDKIESLNIPELKVMVRAKQPGYTSYRFPRHLMPRIVGFAPLKERPWVLGVSQSKADFVIPLNRLIWLNGTSVLVVGGITAITALFLARSIARPIRVLTAAALAVEQEDFNPQALAVVSHTQDDMGRLVRVFLHMAREVRAREQNLKQQVIDLKIEIDETKRAKDLVEITENEHFRQLHNKIQKLREQAVSSGETPDEYYQRLQSQVQSIKERSRHIAE